MALFKICLLAADLDAGRRIAELLGEIGAPEPLAVTLFAGKAGFEVEAYYRGEPALDTLERALAPLGPGVGKPRLEPVPEQNWVALSQASLPPIAAGRFVIHASHDRARFATRRWAIEIDAGEAFGTGHGATTALCLEALDRLCRRRCRIGQVLDLGCGTGILAIAAARALPAARVVAVDNDPVAVAVARANVRRNRVHVRVRVLVATGFAHPALRGERRFGLVLANLLPGPLIALAPAMRRAIRPGGVAVLCGLLDHQAREVIAPYRACGFRLMEKRHRAGWTALVLQQD